MFRESADTVEGSAQHKRVDARPAALPEAGESEEKASCAVRDAFERTAEA